MEEKVGQSLWARKLTLAVAESCSGGLICHRLTNVPGSSDYFLGGLVTYSNQAKIDLLKVPASTLQTSGAVSTTHRRSHGPGSRHAVSCRCGRSRHRHRRAFGRIPGKAGGDSLYGIGYFSGSQKPSLPFPQALARKLKFSPPRPPWTGSAWSCHDSRAFLAIDLPESYRTGLAAVCRII